MTLDERTAMLIAVGASIAANCQPCLEINVARAQEHGIDAAAIADALEIERRIRRGAAAKMDRFATGLTSPGPTATGDDCGCDCDR
jgi:AhpD family alkylhydroperoxidase